MENFGKRMKALRDTAGFKKQKDFADAIEITQASLSGYEVGDNIPKIDVLDKIIRVTKVNSHWLLTGEAYLRNTAKNRYLPSRLNT